MTEEQYNKLTDTVDAIADSVTARIGEAFDWALTPEEAKLLQDAPGIEEADAILAKYTAGPVDVRREMVLKGYAIALGALPEIMKSINIGWDAGNDA